MPLGNVHTNTRTHLHTARNSLKSNHSSLPSSTAATTMNDSDGNNNTGHGSHPKARQKTTVGPAPAIPLADTSTHSAHAPPQHALHAPIGIATASRDAQHPPHHGADTPTVTATVTVLRPQSHGRDAQMPTTSPSHPTRAMPNAHLNTDAQTAIVPRLPHTGATPRQPPRGPRPPSHSTSATLKLTQCPSRHPTPG
jgi:hypothetical protein